MKRPEYIELLKDPGLEIYSMPQGQDNFAYLLICKKTLDAAVVDPSEADPVRKEINYQNVKLTTILNTHHHWDHVGGNKELKSDFPDLKIYGHSSDRGRIPEQTEFLEDGDHVMFGEQSGSFLYNPGHTLGAITYLFGEAAFTGDTLFLGDVGIPDVAQRYKGVSKEELAGTLYDSVNERIKPLPENILIYPAHGPGTQCGKNLSQETFSTLYDQKQNNYALKFKSKYDFINSITMDLPSAPEYFRDSAILNKDGYKNNDDFGKPTSSFTICTFWLIDSLYKIGEKKKAKDMFDQLLSFSNHLGLFSEDIDFKTKRLLGNFPQAYSHLALIETAANFSKGISAENALFQD